MVQVRASKAELINNLWQPSWITGERSPFNSSRTPGQIRGRTNRSDLLRVQTDLSPGLRRHLQQGVVIRVHPVRPVVSSFPVFLHGRCKSQSDQFICTG